MQTKPLLKPSLPEIENKSFRENRQVYELRKRLEEQKETIQELVQLVQQSKTNSYKPQPQFNPTQQQIQIQKPENDAVTIQLLEEVKTLRKQINNIEYGPRQSPQPIFVPQYLPSPPQQQQQQPMMPPYMYMNPYFQMGPYMYEKPKKKEDPYKKLVMEMLLKNSKDVRNRRKRDITESELEQSEYINSRPSSRHHSQNNRSNRKKRDDDDDNDDDYSNKHRRKRHSDRNSRDRAASRNASQISNNSRVNAKQKKRKEFTEEEKLKLKRKLIGTFWFMRVGLSLKKYLRKVWYNRRQEYYEKEAQEKIDQYDGEFNYKEVFILFVVECNKSKYFTKNWVFFDNQDVQVRCKNLFLIISVLFKKLPFLTKNTLSEEHKAFIRKISTPNGYLLPGHPQFVADRVELRPNMTIGPIDAQVSKMIQMDYVYIQVLVQRVILIHEWYSQFAKIPNYKNAMKILSTVLHQLYIDHFIHLAIYENSDAIYNTSQIIYCDFTKENYVDVTISVNDKHEKYQPTKNCCILGLGSKEEMQPLYDQPGYKELQTQFKEYCDYFYTSVIQ